MKITKDSTGTIVLNDGSHRVTLSAALVQAIGEQVYAESPRAECEGRMVVVALPSVKVAIRPGVKPTHDDDLGGQRWHYLTPDAARLDPYAYLYRGMGTGWWGEAGGFIFPDGYSPIGPATREHIQERIEAVLVAEGYEIMQDAGDGDHTTGYGAFPGGDPRLFEPDPECSTPEEREAHRVACQEADAMEARGEVPDEVPAHQWVVGKDAVIHVAAPGFGLGVYQIEAPSAAGRLKKPHERNSEFVDALVVTVEGRNER